MIFVPKRCVGQIGGFRPRLARLVGQPRLSGVTGADPHTFESPLLQNLRVLCYKISSEKIRWSARGHRSGGSPAVILKTTPRMASSMGLPGSLPSCCASCSKLSSLSGTTCRHAATPRQKTWRACYARDQSPEANRWLRQPLIVDPDRHKMPMQAFTTNRRSRLPQRGKDCNVSEFSSHHVYIWAQHWAYRSSTVGDFKIRLAENSKQPRNRQPGCLTVKPTCLFFVTARNTRLNSTVIANWSTGGPHLAHHGVLADELLLPLAQSLQLPRAQVLQALAAVLRQQRHFGQRTRCLPPRKHAVPAVWREGTWCERELATHVMCVSIHRP